MSHFKKHKVMILDLTLKNDHYLLKIHKNFFINKSMPLSVFQADNLLMQKYAYLGLFQIGDSTFGFDACFKLIKEEDDYVIYKFQIPGISIDSEVRKMMMTIYLSTYYVVEHMFYEKEYFSTQLWDDQSLSFIIFDGGGERNSYSIGGQLYPWFKKQLNFLPYKERFELNDYVSNELKRYYGERIPYSQVTIKNDSFFIQVNAGGRWISWNLSRDLNKPEEFDSHNIDFRSDQELCFVAIIAMNTWLREH